MGDGSHWIWNNADQHFPDAIQIVDLYHAREHLWDLARKLNPSVDAAQERWLMRKLDWLENGKIEKLATALRKLADTEQNSELAKAICIEAEYFDGNRDRMRYPEFRAKSLFVGSGVIEAGCKTVIGSRLKQSGMFWTVRGANAIIALRCCLLNGELEDYWDARRIAYYELFLTTSRSHTPRSGCRYTPPSRTGPIRHSSRMFKTQRPSAAAELLHSARYIG